MIKKILTALFLVLGIAVYASAEMKVDTLTWFDYDSFNYTNSALNSGGAPYIGRAYLNIRGDFAKDWWGNSIFGRVTLDFAAATTAPTEYVKYAYVDWKFLDGMAVLGAGLQPCRMFFQTFNDYLLPVKTAAEFYSAYGNYKIGGNKIYNSADNIQSADYGLSLEGKIIPIDGLTKNLISYYIQAFDGEGYKALYSGTTPTNQAMSYNAMLIVSPITGLDISGSYYNNPSDYTRLATNYNYSYSRAGFYVWAHDVVIPGMDSPLPIDLLFEYTTYTDTKTDNYGKNTINGTTQTNITGQSMEFQLGYSFFDKMITPYVRYDMMTPDVNTVATNKYGNHIQDNIFYIGANFRADPAGNLTIKPIYGMYLTDGGDSGTGKFEFKIEAEYKFGVTAWQ